MNLQNNYKLVLSGIDHKELREHLFPEDGYEAAAIVICGRGNFEENHVILAHKTHLIPYKRCKVRSKTQITWPISDYYKIFEEALKKDMVIMKIHSHPSGYKDFSETDDKCDTDLFDALFGWTDSNNPHVSAIMLPDGNILARTIDHNLNFKTVNRISIVGDDIKITNFDQLQIKNIEAGKRTLQTFGEGTTKLLQSLKIGVIGCSGTGSPTIEQLARLHVGELVIVDPKKLKVHNVNRILNSTVELAEQEIYKTELIKESVEKIGFDTIVRCYNSNIYDDPTIIHDLSTCDILFGGVDTYDGRHLTSQLAAFYLIPYFDMGIDLQPDGNGNIDQICGNIHYTQPKKSSLRTRGVYTEEKLRAAIAYRTDPDLYNKQRIDGYLAKVGEESPAVISINMQISAMTVNDFLARIHNPSFRYESNSRYATTVVDFSDWRIDSLPEGETDKYLLKKAGRGDCKPLLNMLELSVRK